MNLAKTSSENCKSQSPYGDMYKAAVFAACNAGASDVHFEPPRNGVDIRFRVFGEMQPPWKSLSIEHRHSFLTELKRQTNLSIAVSGRAQDSRASFHEWGVDLRVNLLPTLYGEKVVLRLLDLKRSFDIDELGLSPSTLEALKDALTYRDGVVLISGPTGSGKTTTLYSALNSVDKNRLNIITLEDPVEYSMDGINQVKVDRKLSFDSALRAILRQDPDVIMLGEIRDKETASLAFKAAATGHLVLSTIHANGAAEVVDRLLHLDVDKLTIGTNLRFSAAQRLVKKLCPSCRIKVPTDYIEKVSAKLLEINGGDNIAGSFYFRNEKGCEACKEGTIGRLPIIEYMDDTAIKCRLWKEDDDESRGVLVTLQQACLHPASLGETDIREVLKIG